MKERGHCTSGVCPDATTNGDIVSISVDNNHRLLQRKRALPWEVLFEIMRRHWQRAGKNTDGRPGLPWDVSLYVPVVVLMLVKNLNARDMEAGCAQGLNAAMLDRLAQNYVASSGSRTFGTPQEFNGPDSTATSVTLIWQANTAAAGFNVYRSAVSTGPFAKLNSTPQLGASFADRPHGSM